MELVLARRIGILAITFLLMFAVGVGAPISPLLAASMGASWVDIGLMGLTWGVALAVSSFVTGRISDRVGRPPLLLTSSVVSALAAFLFLQASSVGQLIAARGLEGLAWACFWPPMEALATETADGKEVGKGVGLVTTVFAAAFAMWSVAGGTVSDLLGLQPTFTVYLVVAASSILTQPFIEESRPDPRTSDSRIAESSSRKFFSGPLVLGYYLGGSETFGFATVMSLLAVFASLIGIPVFWIGVLFSVFWAGRILSGTLAGAASDRLGRKRVALLALAFGCVGYLAFAVGVDLLFLIAGALLVGLSIGAIYPVNLALIADNIEPEQRGAAMGIYEMTCAITFMVSSAIGGLAAEAVNPRTPYVLAAVVYFFCGVALQRWLRQT
jgi:MFS family permease